MRRFTLLCYDRYNPVWGMFSKCQDWTLDSAYCLVVGSLFWECLTLRLYPTYKCLLPNTPHTNMHTQLRLNFHKISKSLIDILKFLKFLHDEQVHPLLMTNVFHAQYRSSIISSAQPMNMQNWREYWNATTWANHYDWSSEAGILFCSRPFEGHSIIYPCTCVKM
jgi:hypothetical protein